MKPYNQKLKERSRHMRSNMTKAEQILWERIRKKQIHGFQFYRQKPLGHFIVDFYCPAGQLIIEVDGSQHQHPEGVAFDAKRDAYMNGLGLKVLRFSNLEIIIRIENVVETIKSALRSTYR